MIKIASLGSGSKGNATLVTAASTSLLIDNGFTVKESVARAKSLGVDLSQLDGILVTHEHSDHIGGVAPLARKFSIPVYSSVGTWHAKPQGQVPSIHYICSHSPFTLGDFRIVPVSVPHDAREPLQFIFEYEALRFGVMTDLGSISPFVAQQMSDLDGLLIEFNHCLDMLMTGPYPPSLKRRVAGEFGHLNNDQALQFVQQLDLSRLNLLVAGHLSEKNNCHNKVSAMLDSLTGVIKNIVVAKQEQSFGWLTLGSSVLQEG